MSTISQLILSKIEKTPNLRKSFLIKLYKLISQVYCKLELMITQNGGLIQDGVKRAQIFNQSPKFQIWSDLKSSFKDRLLFKWSLKFQNIEDNGQSGPNIKKIRYPFY
jgi:hypothetical protein